MKTQNSGKFALAAALALAMAGSVRATALSWSSGGLNGGGNQNCVAVEPSILSGNTYPLLLSGADVSGILRSTDYGKSWVGVNAGTGPAGPANVGCVDWDPTVVVSNNAYAYAITNQGFYQSTDSGQTWTLKDASVTAQGNGVGSLRWPRPVGRLLTITSTISGSRYLFAAATDSSGNGHLYRASDSGTGSWSAFTDITPSALKTPNAPALTGVCSNPNAPKELFLATSGSGVWEAADATLASGISWTPLCSGANLPMFAQTVLVLPNSTGSSLYVTGAAADPNSNGGGNGADGGVWTSTAGGGFTNFSVITPYNPSGNPSTTQAPYQNTSWLGLDGYFDGTTTHLYASAAFPQPDSVTTNPDVAVIKLTNSGSGWTVSSLTTASNLQNVSGGVSSNVAIFDASGEVWWQSASGGNPNYVLGGKTCSEPTLALDFASASPPNHLFSSGRAAIWSTNLGSVLWYPDVGGYSTSSPGGGMGVKVVDTAAIDPNNTSHLFIGTPDWTYFYSTNAGASFTRNAPPGTSSGSNPAGDESKAVCVDPNSSYVYLGTMDESTDIGNVWVWNNTNPATGSWQDSGLCDYMNGKGDPGKVQGIAVGGSRSAPVCVAVTYGSSSPGVWHGVGNSTGNAGTYTWTGPDTSFSAQFAVVVPFYWDDPAGNTVFAYEQSTGLWESTTGGTTGSWSKVGFWSLSGPQAGTGFMAGEGNPTASGFLFVSPALNGSNVQSTGFAKDDVYQVHLSGGTLTKLAMGLLSKLPAGVVPGPLAYSGGILYVACIVQADGADGTPPTGVMYKCANPDNSSGWTWTEISDSTVYPGQGSWAGSIVVNPANGGNIYIGTQFSGMVMSNGK